MAEKDYIPIILGEETRPKVELFEDKRDSVSIRRSMFYQQYCTALTGIAEFIAYSKQGVVPYSHSNIFVFTGERGSGKTSCMSTVRELLCNPMCRSSRDMMEIDSSKKQILQTTNFHSCEFIDPIYFDVKHNILDLFIGTLFRQFLDRENSSSPNGNNWGKREHLLSCFSEARRNMSLLDKEKALSEFDDLEQLKDLAASVNLKNSLNELVSSYISYVYGENGVLVLCIDDIDMNMSDGFEMIELVRKYLNSPKLIILMAIKIDQLSNVIRIKYTNDFSPILQSGNVDTAKMEKYDETITQMVERYITKLFPLSQRVLLPTVADLLEKNVCVFEYNVEGQVVL